MSFYKPVSSPASYQSRYKKKKKDEDDPDFDNKNNFDNFLEDWEKLRKRHEGQQAILDAVFVQDKRYIFARIGRKGAKTTTNIDISWKFSLKKPRRTTFICLPTITQAIEVYWDEKRLQWCDVDNDHMADKYISSIDNNKHMITFNNGSIIKLIGTWSEARGRGTQPDLLIVDEIQDASGDYLDAMEPNLAAKADSLCIMSGTPPRKKNHYHVWEDRIKNNPEGFSVKYSSYINTALPHLKPWLDNKREELIKAGKEDVWLREYMAEDCFRSDDRVLPDIHFVDHDNLLCELKSVDPTVYQPVFGLVVTDHHLTATYNVLFHSRYDGTRLYTLESQHLNKIWDKSYAEIFRQMNEKMQQYSSIFKKEWRKVVLDDTNSFADVIPGVTNAKIDLKWMKRGIPLLKEMILEDKLTFSTFSSDIGVQAQNLLKEDDVRDYPLVCSIAMIVNEFYVPSSLSYHEQEQWDKMKPLRDAGIVTHIPRQKFLKPYRGNWD